MPYDHDNSGEDSEYFDRDFRVKFWSLAPASRTFVFTTGPPHDALGLFQVLQFYTQATDRVGRDAQWAFHQAGHRHTVVENDICLSVRLGRMLVS